MNTWTHMVKEISDFNDQNAGPLMVSNADAQESNVTFHAGPGSMEMLKVGKDGFWVRGVKVEQDDTEAEKVYNAFRAWMVWAELNKR